MLTFAQSSKRVVVTDITGAVGVATTRQLTLAIDRAQAEYAETLIFRRSSPSKENRGQLVSVKPATHATGSDPTSEE